MGGRCGIGAGQGGAEGGGGSAYKVSASVYGEETTLEGHFVIWPTGNGEELFGEGGGYGGEQYIFQREQFGFGEQVDGRV